MRSELLQPVEDVRGVDDGDVALLALLSEETHQVRAAEDVEVDGDLIEEEDAVLDHQAVRELHAAALAVGDLVHPPLRVDVEDVDDALLALGVHALDGVQHLPRGEVSREGDAVAGECHVSLPVAANVGQLAGGGEVGVVEGFTSVDEHLVLRDHVLTSEDLEERRLARAVRAQQEAARSGFELEVHLLDERPLAVDRGAVDVGVGPVEVVDVDAPRGRRGGGVHRRGRGGRGSGRGGSGLRGRRRGGISLLSLSLGERREGAGGLHHRGGGVDAAAGAALPPGCRDRHGHVCFKGGCVVGGCARSPLWRFEKISDARKSVTGVDVEAHTGRLDSD